MSIAGDEIISRSCSPGHDLTIEQMYRIKNDIVFAKQNGKASLRHKFVNIGHYTSGWSMCADGILRRNIIRDIRPTGTQPVCRVTLFGGATVRTTLDNKFPTPIGERTIYDMSAGDLLFVKGREGPRVSTSAITAIEPDGETNTYDVTMDVPNNNFITRRLIITCAKLSAMML